MSTSMRFFLGAELLCEYYTRLRCGIYGPNKVPQKSLTDAVWIDAGYALDAPDEIPAGGTTSFVSDGILISEQILVNR